jgi:hypothetical protein
MELLRPPFSVTGQPSVSLPSCLKQLRPLEDIRTHCTDEGERRRASARDQSCAIKLRSFSVSAGNAQFAGHESLIVFDEVFVPHKHVFKDGEWAYASSLGAVHHLSSFVLCVQNGSRRCLDRRGRFRRRAQRRRERLSYQGQARRTRFPYEIARLAQDIAGGLVATMPSEKVCRTTKWGRRSANSCKAAMASRWSIACASCA